MTNYEKYFSTPEKAAEMQIHSGICGFEIYRFDIDVMDEPQPVASIPCVADDPAALYEWLVDGESGENCGEASVQRAPDIECEKLIAAVNDVLRHADDTVWVGMGETLVDRMVSLGVYGHDVYEGAKPWEAQHYVRK